MSTIKFLKDRILLITLVSMFVCMIIPTNEASAKLADGKYTINYTVTKPEDNSVSIANDYFQKPATLFVENGVMKIQINLKNSSWITKFEAESGGNSVVSKNSSANTRIVQFNVTNLSSRLLAKIKVDIEDMNYHHDYTIGLAFDEASASVVNEGKENSKKETSNSKNDTTQVTTSDESKSTSASLNLDDESVVDNPKTEDTTKMAVFVVILVISVFLLIRRIKFQR